MTRPKAGEGGRAPPVPGDDISANPRPLAAESRSRAGKKSAGLSAGHGVVHAASHDADWGADHGAHPHGPRHDGPHHHEAGRHGRRPAGGRGQPDSFGRWFSYRGGLFQLLKGGPTADIAILLHGVASSPVSMLPLAHALARSGVKPYCWTYSWRTRSLDVIVEQIATRLRRLRLDDRTRVHFVGHSMGGLVIRALLSGGARPKALGHVVMLGTPNGGSAWAELLDRWWWGRLFLGESIPLLAPERAPHLEERLGRIDYPLGIIAGNRPSFAAIERRVIPEPSDGEVAVAATHVDGARAHLVLPLGHTQMLYSRQAHVRTVSFIRHGHFGHE